MVQGGLEDNRIALYFGQREAARGCKAEQVVADSGVERDDPLCRSLDADGLAIAQAGRIPLILNK